MRRRRIAILGAGNLGRALAEGWVAAEQVEARDVTLTRRRIDKLADMVEVGFGVEADNVVAVSRSEVVVLAVQPGQVDSVLAEVSHALRADAHQLISVVSGVSLASLRDRVGDVPVVRAMPNTAVSIRESMTCLSAEEGADSALASAVELFDSVGRTLVIREEMMVPATALCACGVAFFLRCIRAASQGGIEIGFHPEEALLLAGQTARGAAALSLQADTHPEREIDRVTTPRGCTITGLNEMEHQGLSSALIKGLIVSARAAEGLYDD
jgi:pyrroline-5-carboxylate reductase